MSRQGRRLICCPLNDFLWLRSTARASFRLFNKMKPCKCCCLVGSLSHKFPKQVYLIQAADGCVGVTEVSCCSEQLTRVKPSLCSTQVPFSISPRTTEQQQRFHDICGNLVKTKRRVVGWWKRLCALKEEKPKMVSENQR